MAGVTTGPIHRASPPGSRGTHCTRERSIRRSTAHVVGYRAKHGQPAHSTIARRRAVRRQRIPRFRFGHFLVFAVVSSPQQQRPAFARISALRCFAPIRFGANLPWPGVRRSRRHPARYARSCGAIVRKAAATWIYRKSHFGPILPRRVIRSLTSVFATVALSYPGRPPARVKLICRVFARPL